MDREVVKISELKAAPYNPRQISGEALAGLSKSLERWGVVQEVVANKRTGYIVGGHQRVAALKKMGVKEVPVVWVDLDDVEEKALNVALNNPHISGEFDDTIAGLLTEIRDGIGPDDFESLMLDDLLPPDATVVEGNTDPDDVPEVPEEPVTKPGDLWVLGNHRLLCGDSTNVQHVERLMDGKKADMVFTDPPYNIGSENKGIAADVSKAHSNLMNAEWDKGFDFASVQGCLLAAIAENATVYVCTSHHLAGSIWQWMKAWSDHNNWCVWSKFNPMPSLMKRHWTWSGELICYGTRGKHVFNFPDQGHALSIWNIAKGSGNSGHPTEKPVSVPEHAVLHSSKKGQVVLDLFGGSGSTLIACEKTNRQCRIMELDPAYCDVIVKRWEDFTGKKAVLEANDATG